MFAYEIDPERLVRFLGYEVCWFRGYLYLKIAGIHPSTLVLVLTYYILDSGDVGAISYFEVLRTGDSLGNPADGRRVK